MSSTTTITTAPATTTTTIATGPQYKLIDLSVSACSSESEVYKSNNVLIEDTYRIWQTKNKTDKSFIELQFPTPSHIKKIEIMNAGSAFIEVLVGLVTWEPTEFQVLVPLTNFMSFSESTNKTNKNRSKSFDITKFSSQTVPRKWERVRIICTQPWGDDNIGISNVKIYGPPSKSSTPKLEDDSNISLTDTSSNTNLLLDTSIETDSNISLKSDKTQVLNFLPTELNKSNSGLLKKPNVINRSTTVNLSNPLPGKILVINQKSKATLNEKAKAASSTNTEIDTEEENDNEKEEIKNKLVKQQQQQKQQKSKLVEPKIDDDNDFIMQDVIINNNNNNRLEQDILSNTNDGETDEECDNLQVIATPKQQMKLTSFGNLLKGVVLVIGGIVNPLKGELRDKALEMGAEYKPDWCREASHLVTPFRNTPKFKTAEKAGGSIIKPKWIEDCYKSKSRLPIKNYTFRDDDSDNSDYNNSKPSAPPPSKTKSISTDSKKRKKKGAVPGSDDSDDDSHIPNVYDYNDGFIDNSFSSSEAPPSDKDPDDFEFQPENVKDLLKDGLDYLQRAYNYKPDRNIQIASHHHHKKQKNSHQNGAEISYKSSPSYKPNKYYNEDYNSSDKNKNNSSNNDNDSNGKATEEKKIKYTPKQPKQEEFDDDLFNKSYDTIEMTPQQVKDEIDRIVNKHEKSNGTTFNSNSIKKQTSPQSVSSNDRDEIIPEKCSTQLPKNNAQDFKGKEYILNPLPSFFEGFEFYLSVKDGPIRKNILRLIIAYKGSISTVPTANTKFIITDKTTWDRLFDITKQKFPNVLFLNPSFVMQSHNYQKLCNVDKHLISKVTK